MTPTKIAVDNQYGRLFMVDAKNAHDRVTSDTSTHGAQKSLAFGVGWLKQFLRRPSTSIRWVETENQLADALTKDMDASWLRKTLLSGKWCISFHASIVRPKRVPVAKSRL